MGSDDDEGRVARKSVEEEEEGLRRRSRKKKSSSRKSKRSSHAAFAHEEEENLGWKFASGLCNMALDTFFSTVEIVNEENIPNEGPVILYGNHNNQFVDGMVMVRAAQRPVSFIIAEVSMHKPVVGDMARLTGAVPVVRPQDRAVAGPGRIESIDIDSLTMIGSETRFTDISKGSTIAIKHVGQFIVSAVQDDHTLQFREIPEDKSPDLTELKKGKYKVIPKVPQGEMFEKVYESLADGKCIGIFPEGGSHDRTRLLPLKAGVAMMALGALARGTPVTVVPVGINYFSGHAFRSKVFVDCGKPLQISPELVEMYQNKETSKDACSLLLKDMLLALESVCITAENFETLKVIRTARRMYQNKIKLTPREFINLNVKFARAYDQWNQNKQFAQLMEDVSDYLDFARSQGLKDKEVRDLPPLDSAQTVLNACKDIGITIALTIIGLPLVLPGLILYAPVPIYAHYKIPKEMKKALAGSSVKIAARDVAASQQIMLGIKMIPMLTLAYILLFLLLSFQRSNTFLMTLFYWFLPIIGPWYALYFCPLIVEKLVRRWKLWPRYLLSAQAYFSKKQRQPAELLRIERKKLVIRIQDLVEELMAETPEEKNRIINRAKILKNRSKSVRGIARIGELDCELPHRKNSDIPEEEEEEEE